MNGSFLVSNLFIPLFFTPFPQEWKATCVLLDRRKRVEKGKKCTEDKK